MIEKSVCKHRIGPSGYYEAFPPHDLVPAKSVRIGWNTNDAGQVVEVLVTANANEWSGLAHDLDFSGGACYTDWCIPASVRGNNGFHPDQLFDPVGAFGTLLSCGFASKRVLRDTLIQFAKIEEATWARRMLFALEGEWSDADVS